MNTVVLFVVALMLARWIAQEWLEFLNQRHAKSHAGQVPAAFAAFMEPATYRKSVDYTLAKSRLHQLELSYDALVLAVFLFSGILPATYGSFTARFGNSAWAAAAYLFLVGLVLSMTGLPWAWYRQFRLEARFGFNNSTQKLWWTDRLKGLLIALVLGWPLITLILKLVEWTGQRWWLWAWASLIVFQLLVAVLAPIFILPLFNKLTPLPEGPLRDRLLALAKKTQFTAKKIQVMDGSKRSRHSNAFFTGFGAFRKIVLFDTLVEQLHIPELEAVLAHEIGHYKKKHIPKMLFLSAISSLAGFYVLFLLSKQEWFYTAFGFAQGQMPAALLLFVLLSGLATFWFSPLAGAWSRRYEYQADAYAAGAMEEKESLIGALRKLNKENLGNLTPHPVYSAFYYSHPTQLEREEALRRG